MLHLKKEAGRAVGVFLALFLKVASKSIFHM